MAPTSYGSLRLEDAPPEPVSASSLRSSAAVAIALCCAAVLVVGARHASETHALRASADAAADAAADVAAAVPSAGAAAAAAAPRLNFVHLLADDLGQSDVAFNNASRGFLTPALDALVADAQTVRLTRFYVQPICAPSRATLMTGRLAIYLGTQNKCWHKHDAAGAPLDKPFISQVLKDAGYATAVFGKWDLGWFRSEYTPTRRGFDRFLGFYGGDEGYFSHWANGGFDWVDDDAPAYDGYRGYDALNGTYTDDLLLPAAAAFVARHAANATPFFAYMSFQNVHRPLEARDAALARFPHLEGVLKLKAAMVSSLDDAVANVTTALVDAGALARTVLWFHSDNGSPGDRDGGSNFPYRGHKHQLWEGGVRVPAFIRVPEALGVTPAKRDYDGLLHASDVFATYASLAGVAAADLPTLDGYDAWNAMVTGAPSPRGELLLDIADPDSSMTISGGPLAALIWGDLKLVIGVNDDDDAYDATGGGFTELYNVSVDLFEQHNLVGDDEHAQVFKRMQERMDWYRGESVPVWTKDSSCSSAEVSWIGGMPLWLPWCDADSKWCRENCS